jgi:hypothetical protein
MAQVIKCLPTKFKALSSNLCTEKKKEPGREVNREGGNKGKKKCLLKLKNCYVYFDLRKMARDVYSYLWKCYGK